ncbi:MAG: AEC family transporter [Candidatus Omnitrophica bacterium]|nr:AEC family transporter [Candidatus Omnitrophota bacterium]
MHDASLLNIYSIITKLIILAGLGFFLYRKKTLTEAGVNFLTDFLIKICVPCLIFTNLVENPILSSGPSVWIFIILSIVIFLVGLTLGILYTWLVKDKSFSKETIALLAFQNCGYLPMNIVYFLFSSPQKDELLGYIFLYILGFNILMWSVGSFFIFKKKSENFDLKSLLNPPVLAIIIALAVRRIIPAGMLPEVMLSPMKMIGHMSFALSMLVLGAGLSRAGFSQINNRLLLNTVVISTLKLVAVPFIFIILVANLKIAGLLGLFIILEAAMPSAASLPIVTKWKGADFGYASQIVFFTHVFSLITVPFWIRVFSRIAF